MKKKQIIKSFLWLLIFFLLPLMQVRAGKLSESPYVTFSPDGKAFTTNAGDKTYQWYDVGTTIHTGASSSLRSLRAGEHYYVYERKGEIPIKKWEVVYRTGHCIHNGYPAPGDRYHGISFGRKHCTDYYYSGWSATCADCQETVVSMLMYMSKEAAASITELDMDLEYYYLCPHCNNLEQGAPLKSHFCKSVSWNRYLVQYRANEPKDSQYEAAGYMEDSLHMYNNAAEYEGKEVTPDVRLRKNTYSLRGYEFAGWNTREDGTGRSFQDGEEILNLTEENYINYSSLEGIVTLYAQWRRSASTLRIDPNGGSYEGSKGIWSLKQEYLKTYEIDIGKLQPPSGYTVSFHSGGGNPVAAVTGTNSFREWKQEQPFRGTLKDGLYTYKGRDGIVDTLTAQYDPDSIILPKAEKTGSSFGGWYYDEACKNLAGRAGERLVPYKNQTLYAKWVDLVLHAEDNYTANGGVGAVDLSWRQQDGKNKAYMLYQSKDGQSWTQIAGANDIGNGRRVLKSFSYSGKEETYVIPYTGFYDLRACGAQGGGYGSRQGGPGGETAGRVWLGRGEKLTLRVGGQNGYNGGGKGSSYGTGGGYTIIQSDRQGILMIAGGGGGAGESGNGGAGGSISSVVTGRTGQAGMAGGGGGGQGGSAGEYIRHVHTAGCFHTDHYDYALVEGGSYRAEYASWWRGHNEGAGRIARHFAMNAENSSVETPLRAGGWSSKPAYFILHPGMYRKGIWEWLQNGEPGKISGWNRFPVRNNTEIAIGFWAQHWGNSWKSSSSLSLMRLQVFDQNGTIIFWRDYTDLPVYIHREGEDLKNIEFHNYTGGIYGTRSAQLIFIQPGNGGNRVAQAIVNERIALPAGTTDVAFNLCVFYEDGSEGHYSTDINYIKFTGGKSTRTICGYRDGEIISSRPAGGGSNYVNKTALRQYSQSIGVQAGNGLAVIASGQIGYLESLTLEEVTARDEAAPEPVASYKKEAVGAGGIQITWKRPEDRGSVYYHRAESYLTESNLKLSDSNVTRNTLTSGVAGYRYLIDRSENTPLSASSGAFIRGEGITLQPRSMTQYLHLAALDRAGNISEAIHIPLGAEDDELAWDILTEPLQISGRKNNIYPAGEGAYYVRADGETPFCLAFAGQMQGDAGESYRITETNLESRIPEEEKEQRYVIATREGGGQAGESLWSDLQKSVEGGEILRDGGYGKTLRGMDGKRLSLEHDFTLRPSCEGKRILIIPRAGAAHGDTVKYSDRKLDEKKGLTLIGDAAAPEILGLEALEGLELLDRNSGELHLELEAVDALSGVREFRATVLNTDNQIKKTCLPEADGRIRINITEDEPVFSGDFTVTLEAVDNVGNERREVCGTTEFSLSTAVRRIKEPHEPVFKRGEGGVLTITTHGYAQRLEIIFPEAMARLDPELNRVIDYSDRPAYVHEEEVEFIIPLHMESEGRLEIVVRAYKGDRRLEDHPAVSVIQVEGSILKEARSRLR